jgi:hypothetical protein
VRPIAALSLALLLPLAGPAAAHPAPARCDDPTGWRVVGTDTFRLPQGLLRSQGVTSDGTGWVFSWQGGLERTDDGYLTQAVGTLPPDVAVQPTVGPGTSHHVGGNHIGDVDSYGGLVYAPVEDGAQSLGVTSENDPEYQRPYLALYDAKTLAYTGVSYPLPLALHAAGVPWVAVNGRHRELYTAEWDMPHDRLNVFDLQGRFLRFVDLHYPDAFGPGFHLSRIQGAKVLGESLYATRDDAAKSLYRIDLETGAVSKVLDLHPGVPAELEGLAVRRTPDGAVLHLLMVLHNKVDTSGDAANIQVVFTHLAPTGC